MIFKPELVDLIRAGMKTETRRPVKPGQPCRYVVGRTYAVQPGRGKRGVCRIRVIDVRRERLDQIDWLTARREGFSTERAFLDYWRGLYGAVDLDQLVWAIRFEVTTLTEIPASLTFAEAARIVESWSCCGQTFTGTSDFISGARSAHVCDIAPEDVPDAETAYAMGKAAALPDPPTDNPYRDEYGNHLPGEAGTAAGYDEGWAAREAAALLDQPTDVRRWEVEVCDECGREVSDSTHATSAHQNGPTHFEPVVAAADYDRLRAAALPDERLREALLSDAAVEAAAMTYEPDTFIGDAPNADDALRDARAVLVAALAAADREAHLEPAPQNDATRAQIVAAKLIADREAPDEETR